MGLLVAGRPIEHPLESVRLFIICKAMEWHHLPNAGGLYDQSPRLLDDWLYIWAKEYEKQQTDAKKAGTKGR